MNPVIALLLGITLGTAALLAAMLAIPRRDLDGPMPLGNKLLIAAVAAIGFVAGLATGVIA